MTPSHRDRLVRLAYRFVWNHDDAEEIAQDALAASCERSRDLRDADRWWSWIRRIVVHRCHALGRRQQTRARHESRIHTTARSRNDAAGGVDTDERKQAVRTLLSELPPRQRDVVTLRHLEGMDYERIAAVLEISAATARVHAHAGRETLRRLLLERHADLFQTGESERAAL